MNDQSSASQSTAKMPPCQVHVIVPARFGSERLPGKPLSDICGRPLVAHVADRALEADVGPVWVATDDERVKDQCEELGIQVMMTLDTHCSGTERVAEVCERLGLNDNGVVINLQGDEPLMPAALIREVGGLLLRTSADMATLSHRIVDGADLMSSNVVKVLSDHSGRAVYFSRAPIPWHRAALPQDSAKALSEFPYQRHIGLYAYKVGFLRQYVRWPEAPAEALERLEQLRALHHGAWVQVAEASQVPGPGVDTEEELEKVRGLLARV